MGKVHYIRRHGRQIAVETIVPGAVLKKKEKRRDDHFVRVPESWMEKQLPALTDTARWPAIVLLWLSFRHHGQVFICPNLERYGISRYRRRTALAKLERAGLIVVQRTSFGSPRIKIV